MHYVPGLDPHPLELYEKRCFSTIGLKANFSAFLNCSEPDPDDYHCLIGQKLQVFNLGVECIVAGEIQEHEAMERFLGAGEIPASASSPPGMEDTHTSELDLNSLGEPSIEEARERGMMQELRRDQNRKKWPKSKDKMDSETNYGPPTINSDLEFWVMDEAGTSARPENGLDPNLDDTGFDYVAPPPTNFDDLDVASNGGDYSSVNNKKNKKNKKPRNSIVVEGLPDQAWEGTIMQGGSEGSMATSCSLSQMYFDAAEAGSIFSTKHGFVSLDTVVSVADMRRRPGARCPVQGIALAGSGDQLYAPYLQRPAPLTDDLVLERRVMLARERRGGERTRTVLQGRIDLAHRMQKPKLLSDMSSFKAANPNCIIDDFAKWYGNPGSPLDDYNDEPIADDISVTSALYESTAVKLDKASEAMRILMATRDFWSGCWEEALPVPASEQDPLFDFAMTVEMVIDYLEQMHPANLVNQVMGVNLSSAYFTLISSATDTLSVGLVKSSFQKLRCKIDKALELLSRDATGALFQFTDVGSSDHMSTTSNQYTSEDAITACEEACNGLSVTETMVARAMSLLQKLPGQYNLVQDLLRLADGSTVALTDPKGRSSFLSAIHQQQKQHSTFTSWESLPKPVLREYVLRNLDDGNPCQLSVRFGDEGAYLDRVDNEGGVLLALMKSCGD
jgi:Rab3 GTPase-activating protein catalytic subunit